MDRHPARSLSSVFFVFLAVLRSTLSQDAFTLPEFRALERHPSTEDSQMPKGVFHYRKSETSAKSQFQVPDAGFLEPMQIATDLINTAVGESTNRHQAMSGMNIPLPFGLKPLSLQMGQDVENRFSMSHDGSEKSTDPEKASETSEGVRRSPKPRPTPDSRLKAALERTRLICVSEGRKECDAALDELHRLQFGRTPAEDRQKLRDSQPRELAAAMQTGLARWLVPGLDRHLDDLVLNATSKSRPHRATVRLPTRLEAISLPPRI